MGLRIPCLRCGKFENECRCPPLPPEPAPPAAAPPAPPPAAAPVKPRPETARMHREKRGGGREVVILEGFPAGAPLDDIARALKRVCGTGGTARGGAIELQGDCRDRVAEELARLGWRTVRAGG